MNRLGHGMRKGVAETQREGRFLEEVGGFAHLTEPESGNVCV